MHTDEWGVRWINDSKATNVESTLVGVAGLTFSRPNTQPGQEGDQIKEGSGKEEHSENGLPSTAAAAHPSSSGHPTQGGNASGSDSQVNSGSIPCSGESTEPFEPTMAVQGSGVDASKPGQARPAPGAVVMLGGIAKVLKSSSGGEGSAAAGLGFWQLVALLDRQRAVVTVSGEVGMKGLRSSWS